MSISNWQTRHFILEKHTLTYYNPKDLKKPLGSVITKGAQVAKVHPNDAEGKKFAFVINTTSVGLIKDEEIKIDFSDYDNNLLFYDLIYNPKETVFLKKARLRGNITMNGKMMFLNQAKYAFNLWTNITPEIDDEVIKLLD